MPNLADHLFRQARERGEKIGLVFGERAFSFAELARAVREIAGGLAAAGIGPGKRVGLMLPSRPDFILHQQAIFALGGIVSPLNIFYRRGEIRHVLESCDLDILLIDREFLPNLPQETDLAGLPLRAILVPDLPPEEAHGLIAPVPRGDPIDGPVDLPPEAIGMMLNTSATTGKSKGVLLSIANLRANYDRTPEWLGLDGADTILCALPLYNTFGLNQGINATFVTGGTLVLLPRFDALACLEAIARHGCSFLPAVPTMLQKMIDHPQARSFDLRSVRRILTGAAPVPAALLGRIRENMGADTAVMTGYGLTEATAIVALDHIELDEAGRVMRPKSLGHVLPGIEMAIMTLDGEVARAGEVGEIVIRGPNVMAGYYKEPEQTERALAGGWLHSGDLGTQDTDGCFYIVDRMKDVIIRGGQNIYPIDVEEALYQVPGVGEVAVVGRPDEALGEVVVAFVAARAGASLTTDALFAHCKAELAYYKVPAEIHLLDELPKGPTGKILRRQLRTHSPDPS